MQCGVAFVVGQIDIQAGETDQLAGDGQIARHGRMDQSRLDRIQ